MGEKEAATTMGAAGSGAMFNPREYAVERSGESPLTGPSDAAAGERACNGSRTRRRGLPRPSRVLSTQARAPPGRGTVRH